MNGHRDESDLPLISFLHEHLLASASLTVILSSPDSPCTLKRKQEAVKRPNKCYWFSGTLTAPSLARPIH